MNQPIGIHTVAQDCAYNATNRMTSILWLQLLFIAFPWQRERYEADLGHELTYENLEDCCQFIGERMLDPKCLQRAVEREKIRRLV